MITEKDIKVRVCVHGPEESMADKTEVSATLHLGCSILVNDNHNHKQHEELLERAKDRVKKEILHKIYGDPKKRLMEAKRKAMDIAAHSPYSNFGEMEQLDKVFDTVFMDIEDNSIA